MKHGADFLFGEKIAEEEEEERNKMNLFSNKCIFIILIFSRKMFNGRRSCFGNVWS
jgi:hypothetical protein